MVKYCSECGNKLIKDVNNKDGVTPSTVHISTTPPNVTGEETYGTWELNGLAYPEGYGTVERCRELAQGIPSIFAVDCAKDERVGYQRIPKTVQIGDTQLNVIEEERINPDLIKPQEVIVPKAAEKAEIEQLVDRALADGAVGAITVAGGMSTRAGLEYPKGMYKIAPLSHKTLFQLFAEQLLAVKTRYGKPLVWFITTSEVTDKPTREYFVENDYFGLDRENIIFIQHESVPAFEASTQKLAKKDKDTILTTPNGHGGLYQAMRDVRARTGGGRYITISALEEARKRGIDTFLFCQVDNPLPMVNRIVIGYHIKNSSDFTTVLIPKRDPQEGLALVTKDRMTGRSFFIEYNQPAAVVIRERPGYENGSINRLVFSYDYLANVEQPPYHIVRNKRTKIFKDGKIQDGKIDKFECLVFDALSQAKVSIFISMPREECYAPFKRMEGPDSPETAAKAISDLGKKWLSESGRAKEISEESVVELSSAYATCPEDIADKVGDNLQIKGKSKIYLGGRDIKIGRNVVIDGDLYIEFADSFDGSAAILDGSNITLMRLTVLKGKRATLSQGKRGRGDSANPNTSRLPVPKGFSSPKQHTQAKVVLKDGSYTLKRISGNWFRWGQKRTLEKRLDDLLTEITPRGPPELAEKLKQILKTSQFVVTTNRKLLKDKDVKICVATCNLGQRISDKYPENTVFKHPNFFSPSPQEQLKILYHELVSHLTKGIKDEDEAMGDTGEFIRVLETHPKRILLINLVNKNRSSLDFPIGLYTLKSYLERHYPGRCLVEIKDVQLERLEDIVDFAISWKPHILGLSLMLGAFGRLKEIMANFTSRISPEEQPLLALGKNIPTFAPSKLLKIYPEAICVRGEGELALGGLLEYIEGRKRLLEVSNIVYLQDGEAVETPRRLLPDLELIGKVDYSFAKEYVSRGGHLWMETSRGCPWGHCTFCSGKSYWGKICWRSRPIKIIVEELKYISEKLGIERVSLTDEEFFGYGMGGIEHAGEFASAIIESGIRVSFYTNARANALYNKEDNPQDGRRRVEVLKLLKQAGLQILYLGMESGAPSQIRRYAKGTDIIEAEETIRICRELGIEMAIGWIMLEPLVTREEILESIEFIRRNRIMGYLSTPLSPLRIYPSIPYHKLLKAEEKDLGRQLISKEFDIDSLTFEIIDYKHPEARVIVRLLEGYTRSEYNFYNSLKWFVRFEPRVDTKEFLYLKRILGLFKEYQIDLTYRLATLSAEELLTKDTSKNIFRETMERRNKLVRDLQQMINEKKHTEVCTMIVAQIENYLANPKSYDPDTILTTNIGTFDGRVMSLWDECVKRGSFKYSLEGLLRKPVGKFIALFNEGRAKAEEEFGKPRVDKSPVYEEFGQTDDFNQVLQRDPEQRLFDINIEGEHIAVNINYTPMLPYHFLVIPNPEACLPQFLTEDALKTVYKVFHSSQAENLYIGFNSRGAWASVNHLHFHCVYYSDGALPIEKAERKKIIAIGSAVVFRLVNYIAEGIVIESDEESTLINTAYSFVRLLQEHNIAHTLIVARNSIYIFPRSRIRGDLNQSGGGFVALGGEVLIGDRDRFNHVTEKEISEYIRVSSLSEMQFNVLLEDWLSAQPNFHNAQTVSHHK